MISSINDELSNAEEFVSFFEDEVSDLKKIKLFSECLKSSSLRLSTLLIRFNNDVGGLKSSCKSFCEDDFFILLFIDEDGEEINCEVIGKGVIDIEEVEDDDLRVKGVGEYINELFVGEDGGDIFECSTSESNVSAKRFVEESTIEKFLLFFDIDVQALRISTRGFIKKLFK